MKKIVSSWFAKVHWEEFVCRDNGVVLLTSSRSAVVLLLYYRLAGHPSEATTVLRPSFPQRLTRSPPVCLCVWMYVCVCVCVSSSVDLPCQLYLCANTIIRPRELLCEPLSIVYVKIFDVSVIMWQFSWHVFKKFPNVIFFLFFISIVSVRVWRADMSCHDMT